MTKNSRILIAVSSGDKLKIKEAASYLGMTISDYGRQAMLNPGEITDRIDWVKVKRWLNDSGQDNNGR